jgi:hypothetical protein
MELFDLLKKFKNIEPDAAFKEHSKRLVLAEAPRKPLSIWRSIATIFETGIAVGLTVFFILVITGQFPSVSLPLQTKIPGVSSAQLSVINPETLRAEAQAVDIQIQLAQLTYQESTATIESTPWVAAAIVTKHPLGMAASSSTDASSASSTASSSLSMNQAMNQAIDQALQALSN